MRLGLATGQLDGLADALRGQIERGDTAPHPGTWHEWLDDVTRAADEDS